MIEKIILNLERRNILPLIVAVVMGLISLFLGQDVNGDIWNYHLYNAYAYLNNRMLYDIGPAGAHSYFNPYLDTFNYEIITYLRPKLAAFVFGFIQGLIAYPIYFLSRYFIKNKSASLLVFLICCFGSSFFLGELGTSINDNIISIPILCSFYLLLKYFDTLEFRFVIYSGLLVGISFGLKLTAATYIITIWAMILVFSKARIIASFYFLVSSAFSIIAVSGYWYYQLYSAFKNPLFPFFNNIFHSPYASTARNVTRDMRFFQFHGLEKILYPFYFADHVDRVAEDPKLFLINALICFVLFLVYVSSKITSGGIKSLAGTKFNYLIVFFFISFYVWQYNFGVYRYFIPTDIISPILIYCMIDEVFAVQRSNPRGSTAVAVFLTFVIVSLNFTKGIPNWGRGQYTSPYFSGNVPQEIKEADIIFTGSYFSAWIVPIIDPKGHVIQINRGLFDFGTIQYWKRYYEFAKNESKKYIIFSDLNDSQSKDWAVRKLHDYYKLKIDFSICKSFDVRVSNVKRTQFYCRVENDE